MTSLDLYLVRHEDAEEAEVDEHRALSTLGRKRMRQTARLVAEQEGLIQTILTSPLVRAVQTAEILAEGLGLEEPIRAQHTIAYPSSLERLVHLIDEVPANTAGVALVGHEPTLGLLANHLLAGRPVRGMRKGAVLALRYERGTGRATFRWVIIAEGPRRLEDLSEY